MSSSLSGKVYVVTGATSGIGLAVADSLVKQGAAIIGVGRAPVRCEQAEAQFRSSNPDARVAVLVADLSIQAQVRSLAQCICETLTNWNMAKLDGLVNNAGTVPFWQTFTPEGFDMQWAVNHLAVFLLTHELLPLLEAAPLGRVVTVSSGSHYGTRLKWDDIQLRKSYNAFSAYKQTKLANVLFTAELNRRLGTGSVIRAFAADPGLVNTEIGLKSNSFIARWIWDIRRRGGISAEESAKGIVFLLTEPTIQKSPEIYWKHSQPKAPSPYALNADAARQLWKISEVMCGIKRPEVVQ